MKRLFPVLFLLSPALGAKPGEVAILPFPGLPPGALEVASDLPLLLAPQASDGGVVLVAVEVPPRFPPGSYRVCLGPVGGEALCREVTVEALAKLRAKVPGEAVGGSLRLALKNEGNLPLRVWLSPAEGSEVFFPPLALSLLPGEEGEAELSLSGFGLLRLRVASEAGEAFYLVRVRPEGGKPLPYTLSGLLEGGYALGTGTSLRLALEGALSREARLALALEGPHPSLRLGVGTGGFSLGFRATGGRGVEEARLGFREGPWEGALGYPPALEVGYSGAAFYRLRLSLEALALGLADGTWAFSGTLPWGRPEGITFRLERYGDPRLYARWEGGAYLGFASGGWEGEGGFSPSGPTFRLGYAGSEGSFTYALGVGYRGGPTLGLRAGYVAPPFSLGGRLELGPAPSLAPFTSFGLGLGYQESPFALGLDLSSSGLWGFLEWQEAPFALRLEGRQEATGARLQLLGSYAFRFPVPEEATLALGGYEEVPLEGRVELLGRPVRGARVEGGLAPVATDEGGRFRLYAPRAGARLRALPPEGLLALPTEAFWKPGDPPPVLALRPASLLRLRCQGGGRGAYLAGEVGAFVPCGGEAFLLPGTYRLLPQALPGFRAGEEEVALEPLGQREVLLAFTPIPTAPLPQARPLRVEWPLEVAPGEVAQVRVRLEGGSLPEVRFSLPVLKERREGDDLVLLFQAPWEARERLEVILWAEGGESRAFLPLNPGKDLLLVRLDPPRASLGERVEVRVEALFPAEEVRLLLPTGALSLEREGEGPPWVFVGTFRVEEVLLKEARSLTGSLRALSLEVRARQGEVERGKEVRLLLR